MDPNDDIPWSEVSVFVGPHNQTLHLIIDGYEMPQELAVHFVQGTLTYEHVAHIRHLLAIYRQQDYLYGTHWDVSHGGAPSMDNPAPEPQPQKAPVKRNKKAELASKEVGDSGPLIIPSPESLGLDMTRLLFYRQLYRDGKLTDDIPSENDAS